MSRLIAACHSKPRTGADAKMCIEMRRSAVLLQLLNAPPAGRGGKAGFLADLSNGKRAVLLEDRQYLNVHIVEHRGV
jgi:hypothetical protein